MSDPSIARASQPVGPVRTLPARSGAGFVSNGIVAVLIFILGVAAGFPAATIGVAFLVDNAVPVFAGLIAVLLVVLIAAATIFAFRRRIWQSLFRRTEFEAERLALPLADFARFVGRRDAEGAGTAAREFAELAIARYSWVMTRRWLVAALSALVVAIAALAGAALLLQQNQLLRDQSVLLAEQNSRIADQTRLMELQIQLGEAQRSTSIVPEILAIGAELGEETAALAAGRSDRAFNSGELSPALQARIIAATNSAHPYRHVASPLAQLSDLELVVTALARRTDLAAPLAEYERWQASQPLARPVGELGLPSSELTDREVSPERGQLISLLYNSRVMDTADLSFAGADFSFAELRQPVMAGISFRHARLRFADFSSLVLRDVVFSAAVLDHARFRGARVVGSSFDAIPGDQVRPPFEPTVGGQPWETTLIGADFTAAYIDGTGFRGVEAVAANFDGAFVGSVDFSGAELGAATFRDTIIIDTTFDSAGLSSVDFTGALVFAADFLTALEAASADQTFVASRFSLEPAAEALADHAHYLNLDEALVDAVDNGTLVPYRVVRVGAFESNPERGTAVLER